MSDAPRRLKIKEWRPFSRNTLRGFATVELPIGLIISDITVHIKNDRTWAGLPAKAQIDREGNLRIIDGKIQYIKILEWRDRELSDRFSDAIISALDAEHAGWRE